MTEIAVPPQVRRWGRRASMVAGDGLDQNYYQGKGKEGGTEPRSERNLRHCFWTLRKQEYRLSFPATQCNRFRLSWKESGCRAGDLWSAAEHPSHKSTAWRLTSEMGHERWLQNPEGHGSRDLVGPRSERR